MMTLWIYLHFPALQLDTVFAPAAETEPAVPVVIVDGRVHQVVQANELAFNQGITLDMGLGSAAALCAELQVHPYDAEIEQRAVEEIAQWLYLVTSDIALYPPQGLLLRATNMLSLYGGLTAYWRTLSHHLDQRGVRYHYGCGFSPLSAMLLAKSGANLIEADTAILRQKVGRFPLTATELEGKHTDKLARVGIRDIDSLLALPMQEIARRFDIDLVNYVGRLLGQFKHPVSFYHPPEAFHSHLELLYEIDNVQWLEKPLRRLLTRLELFLTLRNQVAFDLKLTLTQRDKIQHSVTFTSARGDYQVEKWAQLCRLSMESLLLEHPVVSLTLSVVRAGLAEQTAEDFFSGIKGQQSALELITLLQAKLGPSHVHKLQLGDDPRPEKRSRYVHPNVHPATTTTEPLRRAELRPSLLLPEPQPLCEAVSLIHGPERIATGWWDGHNMIRDYFIARTEQGRWLWVFRTPEQQWFIHGQFS